MSWKAMKTRWYASHVSDKSMQTPEIHQETGYSKQLF